MMSVSLPLVPIRLDRKKQFDKALQAPVVFDYFGLERAGHFAIFKWLLTCGPQPHMHVQRCSTSKPRPNWYHPNGWFTTAIAPPQSVGLTYQPDSDLTSVRSRLTNRKTIVSVRDIRNMFASRFKWHLKNERIAFRLDNAAVQLWKQYALQVLGDVDHFDGKAVGIVYDKWVASDDYRQSIVESLNSKFGWDLKNDGDRGRVINMGGGSSFDGKTFENNPEKMKVLERWKQIEEIEFSQEILDLNDRLLAL